jgi:hypothetical protein
VTDAAPAIRIGVSACLLGANVRRHGDAYLLGQTYLAPGDEERKIRRRV